MPKRIEYQLVYKKQVSFIEQQRKAFEKLKDYDVNINQFIRQAVKEKIQREWKEIKERKEKIKMPF